MAARCQLSLPRKGMRATSPDDCDTGPKSTIRFRCYRGLWERRRCGSGARAAINPGATFNPIGPRAGLLQRMPLWERRPRRDGVGAGAMPIGPGAGLLQRTPLWERRPRRDQPLAPQPIGPRRASYNRHRRCGSGASPRSIPVPQPHRPGGGSPTTNAPVGAAPPPRSTPAPQPIGPRAGLPQRMPLWERRRRHPPSPARGRGAGGEGASPTAILSARTENPPAPPDTPPAWPGVRRKRRAPSRYGQNAGHSSI